MKLLDFVVGDAILTDLAAGSRDEAIREIVRSLVEAGSIPKDAMEDVIDAIIKREEMGSTGIGNGVAVPHAKHKSVKELVATVALSRQGVDFQSLDGQDVHILFLLVSPPDRPGDHLRALKTISRHLRKEDFCNFLKQAQSREDVLELLREADNDELD